jgi:hypothetical protein
MKAVSTPINATESRLLREPRHAVARDDADQDLMFPVCGGTEPYYSFERHAIVIPVQASLCSQEAATFVFPYAQKGWTLPLFERGER